MTKRVTPNVLRKIMKAYASWKRLNIILQSFASRTVNFPEAISESIASYYFDYDWHNNANSKLSGDGMTDDNLLVEVKATSNYDSDLTSFSPNTVFDILIFARLDKENDILYLYDLDMTYRELQDVQVNALQTVLDQQKEGKRPRFSVIDRVIKAQGLTPTYKVDLRELAMDLGVNL